MSLTHRGKNEILSWLYMKNETKRIEIIPSANDSQHFDIYNMCFESRTNRAKLLGIEESDSVVCYQESIGN